MSKKKSIISIAIALVLGIAIGVGVTLGVTNQNTTGSAYVPSEYELISEDYTFPYLESRLGGTAECSAITSLEVYKTDGEITEQRINAIKWTYTIENFSDHVYPYLIIHNGDSVYTAETSSGTFENINNKTTGTVIFSESSSSSDSRIFKAPGEYTVDLHILLQDGSHWFSEDGKFELTGLISAYESFMNGDYSDVTFYGTEEELLASDYCFMKDSIDQITFADAATNN